MNDLDLKTGEDLYRLFRIGREATPWHIRHHYRKLVLVLHPDQFSRLPTNKINDMLKHDPYARRLVGINHKNPLSDDEMTVAKFELSKAFRDRIAPAFEVLKDEQMRRKYDQLNDGHGLLLGADDLATPDFCEICCADRYRLLSVHRRATNEHIKSHLEKLKVSEKYARTLEIIDTVFQETFSNGVVRELYDSRNPRHGLDLQVADVIISCQECVSNSTDRGHMLSTGLLSKKRRRRVVPETTTNAQPKADHNPALVVEVDGLPYYAVGAERKRRRLRRPELPPDILSSQLEELMVKDADEDGVEASWDRVFASVLGETHYFMRSITERRNSRTTDSAAHEPSAKNNREEGETSHELRREAWSVSHRLVWKCMAKHKFSTAV